MHALIMRRIIRIWAVVLMAALFTFGVTGPGFAVTESEEIRAQIQKRGVGEKAKVKLTLQDKSKVVGFIKERGEETFTLVVSKTKTERVIGYTDVTKVQNPGMSKGAKIAIIAGVAVGALLIIAATVDPIGDIKFSGSW